MTPQEIIKEIYKLPPTEQKEVMETLTKNPKIEESEDLKIQKLLFEAGLLEEIKPLRQKRIGEFPAIEINGEPISETIIRERR